MASCFSPSPCPFLTNGARHSTKRGSDPTLLVSPTSSEGLLPGAVGSNPSPASDPAACRGCASVVGAACFAPGLLEPLCCFSCPATAPPEERSRQSLAQNTKRKGELGVLFSETDTKTLLGHQLAPQRCCPARHPAGRRGSLPRPAPAPAALGRAAQSWQRLRDPAACSPPTSFLASRPPLPASPSPAPPHSCPFFSFSGLGGLPACPLTTACSPCCRRDWCNSFPLPSRALQLTQPSCRPSPRRLSFTRMQFASINYCSSLQ